MKKKRKGEIMTQKLFLTSALAMGVFAPAFAQMTDSETFPNASQGEYMQENTRYIGAATSTNMAGVYQDGATVNAVAEYTDILYNIAAGNYLAAGSDATNGTQCPAGSWCPGLTNALYNASDDQGINSCPNEYALSAAGASSQNDCYRTCTNADVEHSTGTMNGGYYYGNNNQCEPTDCVNGWHLKQGLNLTTAIGTSSSGESSAYIDNAGTFSQQTFHGTDHDQAFYGLTDNNTWAVYYDSTRGMLTGQARCSTQSGSRGEMSNGTYPDITTFASLTDETGQDGARYCYCNVTGYTPNGGTLQAVSSPWVFLGDDGSVSDCASGCTYRCVGYMRGAHGFAFRAALLGSVQPGLAMCEANVININWNDVDPEYAGQNNEGTAVYGEDVRTPVKAATKKGQTFRGWRFSKPEQTDLP